MEKLPLFEGKRRALSIKRISKKSARKITRRKLKEDQ
jgi:hypothetical protein